MKIIRLVMITLFFFTINGVAEAKWWIFGQANEEVSFSYLYLNHISYEESGPKTSVPKNSLEDGLLLINGRARVGKGKIGGVRVSVDDRASWQDAKFADDGTFEFRFRPELGKAYILFLEVTDTAGKTNDVEKTRKELTIIESNSQQLVRAALDELVAAYRDEDPARFMKLVSGEFTGDSTNLDRAIRKDFSSFDNIDLRFTLNNVTLDPRGRAFAAITFNRAVTSNKSGKTLSDKGVTEFIFKLEEGQAKVFSMKNPLIFGLSDPAQVATGTSQVNQPVLVVDGAGNVALVPASIYATLIADGDFRIVNNPDGTTTITTAEGTTKISADGQIISQSAIASATVEGRNNLSIVSVGHPPTGLDFVTGEVISALSGPIGNAAFVLTGGTDGNGYGFLNAGNSMKDLGVVSLASVTEAPASGYSTYVSVGANFVDGHTYAFLLANGKYALMEVLSVTVVYPAPGAGGMPTVTQRVNYKYQPSGARQFLP